MDYVGELFEIWVLQNKSCLRSERGRLEKERAGVECYTSWNIRWQE